MPSKFRYEFSISRSGKQIGSQMKALGVHLVSKNASLPGKLIYGGFDLFFFGLVSVWKQIWLVLCFFTSMFSIMCSSKAKQPRVSLTTISPFRSGFLIDFVNFFLVKVDGVTLFSSNDLPLE